jgi:hypothetical protein
VHAAAAFLTCKKRVRVHAADHFAAARFLTARRGHCQRLGVWSSGAVAALFCVRWLGTVRDIGSRSFERWGRAPGWARVFTIYDFSMIYYDFSNI